MLGAIVGDIVGSVYEFDNHRSEDFPLFAERSGITNVLRKSDGKVASDRFGELQADDPDTGNWPFRSRPA